MDMDEITLHGRERDRDAVTTAPTGLILVVGDSGIGKSSFLSSLTVWPTDSLVSSPIVLKSIEGSLQTALADAISDCMSQYLDVAPDARKAWTVMKSIGDRATSITGREIGHAVLAGALAYAETKLGKEISDIGKKVLGDVAKGGKLGFADRLATIRVPDRAKELFDIATEFGLAVGRPVVLRLDNAERLAPSDQGLFVELVDAVGGSARVVACITPHHAAGDEVIRQVTMRGAIPHELLPLSRPSIEEWLASAEVPPSRWDTIVQLTSGYPFFIADSIRLSHADGSFDELATPNGFDALMRASWNSIPEAIRATAARLAPFTDPPNEDFLLDYLGFNILQWKILTGTLLESGIFVRRSDGEAWFHDRRRVFIWNQVLADEERKYVAGAAFAALESWIDNRTGIELWVLPAAAVLARAAEPSPRGDLTHALHTQPDECIALLWGLIEVLEPTSVRAPYAEIGEVIRHAEVRSRRALDALSIVSQLEADGLVETLETGDARLLRSNVQRNTDYAVLLGEIQLRFQSTPRPRLAGAAFDTFVQPVLGQFDAAVVALGRTTLAEHQEHTKMLRDPRVIGNADKLHTLGATVVVDGQPFSFTARFPTYEGRTEAKKAIHNITELSPRVQLDRVIPLPQPRVRYARYRLGIESLGLKLKDITSPLPDEIISFLDLRARYAEALGTISSDVEVEVLGLGLSRYLVDTRTRPGSWLWFQVRTDTVRPTLDVSDISPKPRDPLVELRLRAKGCISGGERIVRTLAQSGRELSIQDPLIAVLEDIETAGKKYNSGLRSVLFPPDPDLLQREIHAERQRVWTVVSALQSVGVVDAKVRQHSLLVSFWEDTETGWVSDFGNWRACVLEIDDNQGAVVVRRFTESPFDESTWPDLVVPEAFEDYAGAKAVCWQDGDASSIVARFLGYSDHDARMMDLDTPIGKMMRHTYEILGEGSATA